MILPLVLGLGEPQLGCQLLKSPRTKVGVLSKQRTFSKLLLFKDLVCEM